MFTRFGRGTTRTMKLLITTLLLVGTMGYPSFAKSTLVKKTSAQAAPVACPEFFLTEMYQVEDHIRLAKEGLTNVEMDGYTDFMNTIAANPDVVNCVDEMGQTPLTAAFDVRENLCALVETAQVLIDHGAKVDAPSGEDGTALYYAVEAYGTVWGTVSTEESYKAEPLCQKEVPQAVLAGLVQQLIAKGANIDRVSLGEFDIRAVAAEYKVQDLLKK